MRAGLAAGFALLFFSAAPVCAQRSETAEVSRQLTEAGRWFEKLAEALNTDSAGFRELNQGMQALATPGLTRERAAAAAPGLRKLLERSRADLRRSGAMLDAMPAFPGGISPEISPKQL